MIYHRMLDPILISRELRNEPNSQFSRIEKMVSILDSRELRNQPNHDPNPDPNHAPKQPHSTINLAPQLYEKPSPETQQVDECTILLLLKKLRSKPESQEFYFLRS